MGNEGFKWARVITDLERVFLSLGMPRHAQQLARFKTGYQRQSEKLAGAAQPPWTTETLVEMAAIFQVPISKPYPMVPNDKRCPFCRVELAGKNAAPVCAVFVDRTLHECRKCSARWLLKK